MTEQEAVAKFNAFMKDFRKDGYSLEAILQMGPKGINPAFNIRPLTMAEMPKVATPEVKEPKK